MAKNVYSAIQRIGDKYAGDASKIWKGMPSSAEVVYRFLEFISIIKIAIIVPVYKYTGSINKKVSIT